MRGANHDIDFPTSKLWGDWYDNVWDWLDDSRPRVEKQIILITAVDQVEHRLAVTFRLTTTDADQRRYECKDAMRRSVDNIAAGMVAFPSNPVSFRMAEPKDGYVLVQAKCNLQFLEEMPLT